MLRTFEIYAKDNFLGYEYAEDDVEALIKSRNKFGAPKIWGIDEYTARKILWREEIENAT
jgi:hypothetical protein